METGSIRWFTSHDGHQPGCMQGLMSMLDFRHRHISQKMLSNRKHESSRHARGTAYSHAKYDTIVHDYDIYSDAHADGLNGTPYTNDSQMSMKEMMEEDLFQLDQAKQTIYHEDEEQRQNQLTNQEAHGKMRLWRRSRMSFDLNDIMFTPKNPTHKKHKSLSTLDVNNMMDELCFQIHHPVVGCLNHNQGHEDSQRELEEQSFFPLEDEFRDATKVLMSHFIKRKNFARGDIVQPSREFLDAIHILKLNKDMFLKFLQDPDSQLVRQLQNLECHQDEKNENSAEQRVNQNRNYPSFFLRKLRGLGSNSSKKGKSAQNISKIVVLQSGLHASQGTINKGQTQNATSHFSLFELMRRFKLSIGKQRPNRERNIEKSIGGENLGVTSSNREYFFTERKPKTSTDFKRKDKVGGQTKEIGLTLEQRIFKFYSEARKHLANSMEEGDDLHVDFSKKQYTKPLGKILSFGDYSSSPICSPKLDSDLKFLRLPILPTNKENQSGNEASSSQFSEQTNYDLPTLEDQGRGNELSGNVDELLDEVTIPRFEDFGGVGQNVEDDEPSNSFSDITIKVQDAKDIITSTDFLIERNIYMNAIPKSRNPSINQNEHGDKIHNESVEERQPLNLQLGCEFLSSPPACHSLSPKSEDVEGQDELIDKEDHPSPISVLDTIYDKDDLSPPRVRVSTAFEQLIQPRKINFEVHTIPPIPCSIMWGEEKDSVFELVNVVIQASGLTWDELLEKHFLSHHLLESSFFSELEFIPNLLYYDPQLIFDLIIEVLDEICRHDFDGILSKVSPPTASKFGGKDMVSITCEGVAWHLQLEGLQHTLDQIIARDYDKYEGWVDHRLDTENIGIKTEEAIMEALIDDTVLSYFGWDLEEIVVLPVLTIK